MMGGRWAYESLNFGGYWAWDPVENASLVPWLTLIGGVHTILIYKHTGHSLRASHFLLLITFSLVLYSTFLTRSGVLGDTSVHAFTDLGMNFQLLAFLFVFLIPAFVLYAVRYKEIPHIVKEEQTSSREFWMFIGSLIFFLAALFIIIATSLPVINKIFGSNFTMGEDSVFSYNRVIIFVAVIIGILTAVIQYLKYKQTDSKFFWKKIIWPTVTCYWYCFLVLAFGHINYREHRWRIPWSYLAGRRLQHLCDCCKYFLHLAWNERQAKTFRRVDFTPGFWFNAFRDPDFFFKERSALLQHQRHLCATG